MPVRIDVDKPNLQLYELDEYRAQLQDDNINFMNLAEPVELKYLNFADKVSQ